MLTRPLLFSQRRTPHAESASESTANQKCLVAAVEVVIAVLLVSAYFYTFSLKNNNSDGGDNSKNTFKDFSQCPKTSDNNSNATPFKELQCFDALS